MGNQQYDGNYAQQQQPPPPPDGYYQQQPDYQQQGYQQPPPQQHPVPPAPPKKSKLPIIVAVVVVIVILAAVGMMFLMGGSGPASSPEGALKNIVKAMNNKDVDAVIACDVASFLDPEDKAELKQELTEWVMEDTGTIKLNSVSQVPKSEVTEEDKEDIKDSINFIEEEFGITVQDWAVLRYSITVTDENGDVDTDAGDDWLVVKVNGKWYNSLFSVGIGMGEEGVVVVQTPLGLNSQGQTTTSVSILVSSAPPGAMIDGTYISLTHEGSPSMVSSVTVYTPGAEIMATYSGGSWTYHSGYNAGSASFTPGVIILIEADSISSGDRLVFSTMYGYYGTTTFTVA